MQPFSDVEQRGARAVGLVVKRARRKLRVTQDELAAHVKLSQPIISRLETGQLRGLRYRNLVRIIAALSVDTEDWIGLVAEPARRALPLEHTEEDLL